MDCINHFFNLGYFIFFNYKFKKPVFELILLHLK